MKLKFKTQMCKHYMEEGECPLHHYCQFAHGPEELRQPNDPLPSTFGKTALGAVHSNYKTNYSLDKNVSNTLVHSPYFRTNILDINSRVEKDYSSIDSFIIYMCVEGTVVVVSEGETYTINKGETLLLPASINNVQLKAVNTKVLEVYF